jgi:23S rRNA pseudouridine2457 synthase
MVSQFVGNDKVRQLGELNYSFPEGIHAVGRLDGNSEGLLILTTDKRVTRFLFSSPKQHKRVYVVMVLYTVLPEQLQTLRNGVSIRIEGGGYYTTPPCEAEIIEIPEHLPIDFPPLSPYAKYSWLKITLFEGKFRQVRKMTGAIGHPCRRLIRTQIEDLELGNLPPGGVREITQDDFFRLLKIDN